MTERLERAIAPQLKDRSDVLQWERSYTSRAPK